MFRANPVQDVNHNSPLSLKRKISTKALFLLGLSKCNVLFISVFYTTHISEYTSRGRFLHAATFIMLAWHLFKLRVKKKNVFLQYKCE